MPHYCYTGVSNQKLQYNKIKYKKKKKQLTIGSYVSVRSSRYEAHGKFGENERCVRVARGVAESNSSFLSALQTSHVLRQFFLISWLTTFHV